MRASLALLLVVALLSQPLLAEDTEQPSLELLEYLGRWEDKQGNWLDPRTLAVAALDGAQIENETGDEKKHD